MIKGNIDFFSHTEVRGWVHSQNFSADDIEVSAYVKDLCVGQGTLDVYRQDLIEAGLGDGWSGFEFKIQIPFDADIRDFNIRLPDCDFVLTPKEDLVLAHRTKQRKELINFKDDLLWLRGKEILQEFEFNLLRILYKFGVCDLKVLIDDDLGSITAVHEAGPNRSCLDNLIDSQTLRSLNIIFDFLYRNKFEIICLQIQSLSEWDEYLAKLRRTFRGCSPVIAIYATSAFCFDVLESTHVTDQEILFVSNSRLKILGAIEYQANLHNIVILNVDTAYLINPNAFNLGSVYLISAS